MTATTFLASTGQFRDLDFALLIIVLCALMFVPEMIEGVHKYRAGRDLARRITAEHEARKALEKRAR
jgi:hypothetical protein